jgi:hypothetical protein
LDFFPLARLETTNFRKQNWGQTFSKKRPNGELSTGVARFFLVQHTKMVKKYKITIKYVTWPQNKQNSRKID